MAAPEQGPDLAVAICNHFNFNSDCATQFGRLGLGSVVTQVVANADVGGLDGQVSRSDVGHIHELNSGNTNIIDRCFARISSLCVL